MKRVVALYLAISLAFIFAFNVHAQTADSIWLTASTIAYKTGEIVTVTVNGASATPIQGFTFQIRYDAECLSPINASSQIPGMNGLALPQISGQVDGSYASTTPQLVNGVLAEVYFQALKGCQTTLILESAALAIRNADGFAAPLPGVTIINNNVPLSIDKEVGASQPIQQTGSTLPLEPTIFETSKESSWSGWLIGLGTLLLFVGAGFILYKRLGNSATSQSRNVNMQTVEMPKVAPISQTAKVHFKHGEYAGKSFSLNKLPFFIGRDTVNDLCLNDPNILTQHAKIFETSNGYYLMDLGGGTYVNGQMVMRNSAFLKSGDVVRIGKSALFVFGP